jgi:hypothetical protein
MSSSYHATVRFRARAFASFLVIFAAVSERGIRAQEIERLEDPALAGRIVATPSGFQFAAGDRTVPLRAGHRVARARPVADFARLPAAARIDLGAIGQLFGNLPTFDQSTVTIDGVEASRPVRIPRNAVRWILQRPGEAVVLAESFDGAELPNWTLRGEARIEKRSDRDHASVLRLIGLGTSATLARPTSIQAGRIDLAFRADANVRPVSKVMIELEFDGGIAPDPKIALQIGWDEETYTVSSPRGPRMAVQQLVRKPGWHRFSCAFDPTQTHIGIDESELAHGESPRGSLRAVRIATLGEAVPSDQTLEVLVDDARVVRLVRPTTDPQFDATQDDLLLVSGDQIFGTILEADQKRVLIDVEKRQFEFPWGELSRVAFRRDRAAPALLDGDWVRMTWLAPGARGSAPEVNWIEGVLVDLTSETFQMRTPGGPAIVVPRDQLLSIEWLLNGKRWLIESAPHHLGDRTVADLEPPTPEREPFEFAFDWAELKAGALNLAVDVIQVEGIDGSPAFSEAVRSGELRTFVEFNGKSIGDLNSQIRTRNTSRQRVQLPIPPGALVAGRNMIRFRQTGTNDDPRKRDNLGILAVAIEAAAPLP